MKKATKKSSRRFAFFLSSGVIKGSLLVIASYVLFLVLVVKTGDVAIQNNNSVTAIKAYKLASFLQPFSSSIQKRLLAAQIIDEEYKTESEETGGKIASGSERGTAVLGATVEIPVLMYHYIRINPDVHDKVGYNLSVTPQNFSAQMDYLVSKGYHPVSLDELGAALLHKNKLPDKPIVITLDDGYKDAYTAAYPILKAHNFKAVDFIIVGVLDTPMYLSWDNIKAMMDVFTFGSHTMTHKAMTYLNNENLEKESVNSKSFLQDELGYPINWFAYPYGIVNNRVAQVVQKAGYIGAFGTNNGVYQSTDHMFTLPRIRIGGSDTVESFAKKLPW
jgi:peptidoglycan/xylan/chitin deacetylase (PgdA/CDA1 family)